MAKSSTRTARRRAVERRRKRARQRRIGLVVVAGVGVVVLGGLVMQAISGPQRQPGEVVPSLGNAHINSPARYDGYNSTPPTSGPHYGQLTQWGVHDAPIQNELQVHNLEDGGVGVQYNCPDDCPELVAQLEEIAGQYPDRVFMAPYPDMEHTIALTAWTRIDTFDEFDAQRIRGFIRAYQGTDHHRRF